MKFLFTKTFSVFLALAVTGCANPVRQIKTYEGPVKPDAEIASVFSGTAVIDGTNLTGLITGVDGQICPGINFWTGGYRANVCGNNAGVTPGKHVFRAFVQTPGTITGGYGITVSWKQSAPFFTDPILVEAGMIYRAVPYFAETGISIKLIPQCKSSNHEESIRRILFEKKDC